MNRNQWAFIISTTLLSAVILIWLDLFLFGKVACLPAWAEMLPFSIYTPSYLIFLCLIPVVFLTDTRTNAFLFTYKSLLLSPVLGLLIYVLSDNLWSINNLFLNVSFNYAWIVLFHGLIPAILLLTLRAAPVFCPFLRESLHSKGKIES